MTPTAITSIVDLRSELHRSILLVGDPNALLQSIPALQDDLSACQKLHICGELPNDDPATELWQRITAIQPERIWIVGGDGTINLVGQCALRVSWSAPCWLTPAGTANDLSRALVDHSSYCARPNASQLQMVSLQPTVLVDLLAVKLDSNPWIRCAANMFTLGTSARNTHFVTSEIKARWGAFAYITQLWRAMGDLEPFSVRMTVGRTEERTIDNILNIFVANGPYCGGGFRVAPEALIDDSLLDVIILKQGTTAELAHLATMFLAGHHLDHPLVEHFTTERLTIRCDQSSPLTVDGESFQASDIEIVNHPARLPMNLVTSC